MQGEAPVAIETDVIVVGSGFGGAMAAYAIVRAGLRVIMLERGAWVTRGPHNWQDAGTVEASPYYGSEPPYDVEKDGGRASIGSIACVGGASVFYGGVSLRLRARDFDGWPLSYADLEPWYGAAETILGVAGEEGRDPTEPYRGSAYPSAPASLSPAAARLADAATALGLRPFRLPLAIRYTSSDERPACAGCATCDTFACAVEAKNDVATRVLPSLIALGLVLRDETVATKILTERGRAFGIEVFDKRAGERSVLLAKNVVLAAGALATPHLLLASGLDRACPAGAHVGRYLMRHCNGIIYGFCATDPASGAPSHKQVGIHDYYFELGSLQQLTSPPVGLVKPRTPKPLHGLVPSVTRRAMGLLAIAEDRPEHKNRVAIDERTLDRYGLPRLVIEHRYNPCEVENRAALLRRGREVLVRAGARVFKEHFIDTFSHAQGTVRMGDDPKTSPLDRYGRFRGVEGLWVSDASAFPLSGAVNPSLTIAANALRVGACVGAAR